MVSTGRENIDDITPDTKASAIKINIVTHILNINELHQNVLARLLHPRTQRKNLILVIERTTETVDARNAGNYDNVASL